MIYWELKKKNPRYRNLLLLLENSQKIFYSQTNSAYINVPPSMSATKFHTRTKKVKIIALYIFKFLHVASMDTIINTPKYLVSTPVEMWRRPKG
jgi:hypothetical protein